MNRKAYITFAWTAMVSLVLLAVAVTCSSPPDDSLQRIRKNGILRVITTNNANSYYIYRDQPRGFEYDLARAFAEHLGVDIELIVPGWDKLFDTLDSGEGDLIAAGMTITEPRQQKADFSDGYFSVQQQVIAHKHNRAIRQVEDLAGATVHIRAGTSYQERLREMRRDGLDMEMVLHHNVPTEELIRRVAEEEIDLTIADSNIALLNRRYFPDIRIAFPIEESQSLGWAVRKGDRRLLGEINDFFSQIREDGTYDRIYQRYYANVEIFDYVNIKRFHRRLKSRLPKYEHLIRQEAGKYGFDWRLIAAIVYQESYFNPRARSHTGVRGLMQTTLRTAKEMGIKNRLDPAQSLKAGVGYLAKLYDRFDDIDNQRDRLLFALASYNVGYGHVRDAQQIARRKGWDPQSWKVLARTLPLLREPEYYRKTTYGYARGTEPVRYVKRILTYYDIIRQKAHI